MKCSVLLTGLLSLDRYRLELGNIGNWYIAQTVLLELNSRYSTIFSTWNISQTAQDALGISSKFKYINYFNEIELLRIAKRDEVDVIEVHGDLLGDNSFNLSSDSLSVSLELTRKMQEQTKNTFLLASSIGPFNRTKSQDNKIKEVLQNYALIYLRESESVNIAHNYIGGSVSYKLAPCPSVLFPDTAKIVKEFHHFPVLQTRLEDSKPKVAIVLSRWNLAGTNFSDSTYPSRAIESICNLITYLSEIGYSVYIVSHSNGFDLDSLGGPVVTSGRDYELANLLKTHSESRGVNCRIISGISPRSASFVLGDMEYVIAGRVHAGMISASQNVPTTFVEYGNGPKAHKVKGFSELFQIQNTIDLNRPLSDLSQYILKPEELAAENMRLGSVTISLKDKARRQFELEST